MECPYQEVGVDFFDTAAVKFVNEVEIDCSPEIIFEVFKDAAAWPKWFTEIKNVNWTSSKPFDVGTTRTILFNTVTIHERFIRWEANKRVSFYFESASASLGKAFAEDYNLIDLGNGKTSFIYTVALTPLNEPFDKSSLAGIFTKATTSLKKYIESV